MDNQQITLINDNYFAGLIDSDFGVFLAMSTCNGKLNINPIINFVNTRFELIEACSQKLSSRNINHHVGLDKATVGRDHKRIKILRLGKCIDFADIWAPFCIVRRRQLELLRQFCLGRVKYVSEHGWKYNNTPYTDDQKSLVHDIKKLNADYNRDDGFRNYTFSWLAGIIDGDGSIYFSDTNRNTKYKDKIYKYRKITPCLKITTESHTALNNIKELYDNLNVKYYIDRSRGKLTKAIKKNSYKYHYSVVVRNFDSLYLLLNKLQDNLVAKKEQAKLMLNYIDVKRSDRHYTDVVYDIVSKVKLLNTVF